MRTSIIVIAAFLLATSVANANFVAYVDLAGRSGDLTKANVVKFLEPIGGSKVLKDYTSGTNTSATLTVTASTAPIEAFLDGTTGSNTYTSGTDAYTVFNGIVDPSGYMRDNQVPSPLQPPFANVTLSFTGLDSTKSYEVVLFGSRQGSGTVTPTRAVQFTLLDVDSFTNSSSAGTTYSGPTDPSVSYDSGGAVNQTAGLVGRFTNVSPGTDGDMQVFVTAPSTSLSGKWYANALRLVEVPEPGMGFLLTLGLPLIMRRRRQ
jgi:hypothetical protein